MAVEVVYRFLPGGFLGQQDGQAPTTDFDVVPMGREGSGQARGQPSLAAEVRNGLLVTERMLPKCWYRWDFRSHRSLSALPPSCR